MKKMLEKNKLIVFGSLVALIFLVGGFVVGQLKKDTALGANSGSTQYLNDTYATTTPDYVSTTTPVSTFTYSGNVDDYDAMTLCLWVVASSTATRIDFFPEVSLNNVDWYPLDISANTLGATTTATLNVASSTFTWLPGATNSVSKCLTIDYTYGSFFRVKFIKATDVYSLSNNYSIWASLRPQQY
jgi:hypothetical protein